MGKLTKPKILTEQQAIGTLTANQPKTANPISHPVVNNRSPVNNHL
tara:strand:- start:326 stop:463 length:138 start_codon:yes stop_codon:yes gene_type:complete